MTPHVSRELSAFAAERAAGKNDAQVAVEGAIDKIMEPGFTPGPWTIRYDTNVFGRDRVVANAGCHCSNVNAEAIYNENIANARLISAAPDLYAACKAALSLISDDGRQGGKEWTEKELRSALRKAGGAA